MRPVDAIRLMVSHVDGGWEAMGVLCGKSGETLRKAFSGKDERYVPSLVDAGIIANACISQGAKHCREWHDAVNAIGDEAPTSEISGTDALRCDLVDVVKRATSVLVTGNADLADNHVSENDYKRIGRELADLREAEQKLQRDLDRAYQSGRVRAVS